MHDFATNKTVGKRLNLSGWILIISAILIFIILLLSLIDLWNDFAEDANSYRQSGNTESLFQSRFLFYLVPLGIIFSGILYSINLFFQGRSIAKSSHFFSSNFKKIHLSNYFTFTICCILAGLFTYSAYKIITLYFYFSR